MKFTVRAEVYGPYGSSGASLMKYVHFDYDTVPTVSQVVDALDDLSIDVAVVYELFAGWITPIEFEGEL